MIRPLLLLSLVCGLAATPPSLTAGEARKPNIIFILADDLGYGDLGCYGQEKIKTPNLDQLAARGMRFRQFYAGSTVCAPSRCSLMTGKHQGHARIRGNAMVPLAPDDVTVAKVLKSLGYVTGLVGKWGLGEGGSTGAPTRQGFDHFFGYLNQVHAHNSYPDFLWRERGESPHRGQRCQEWRRHHACYPFARPIHARSSRVHRQKPKAPVFPVLRHYHPTCQ